MNAFYGPNTICIWGYFTSLSDKLYVTPQTFHVKKPNQTTSKTNKQKIPSPPCKNLNSPFLF